MNYFTNQQEAEHDEDDLPFALSQEDPLQTSQYSPHASVSSNSYPSPSCNVKSFEETSSAIPQLASSILSNPTDGESQHSSPAQSELYTSASLSHADSRCLDAAASLLFPNSSLNMSSLPLSHPSRTFGDSTSMCSTMETDFSQLLKRADASVKSPRSVIRTLPALPEDMTSDSPVASAISSPPILPRTPLFPSPNMMQTQTTIVEGMCSTIHTDQRLASLAGATARRTSANSFVVAIDILSNETSILDIIGSPTLLSMWCDAVPSLIVTECGEASRRGTDRQHDAEWMEATTPYVIPPPNSSCVYSLFRTIQSSLGFPSFGRITMLVERQRGQVAVTVGTFDGGIDVYHKLEVQPLSGGKVRVTDEVRLQCEDESSTWSSLQSIFLPDLGDHMNQAVSSMARLRFLVERGESPACIGYTAPVLAANDDMTPLL